MYASLTMMHFADKRGVIEKAAALLNPGGLLCLSLDKNRSEWIDMGTRRVKIYPDDPAETARLMTAAGLLKSPLPGVLVSRQAVWRNRSGLLSE